MLNFDIDYALTSINYNEFSFDLWENYLISYKEQFLIPVQLKDFFNQIDDFFYNTKYIETKKLLFSSIKSRMLLCVGELQALQNNEEINKYKRVLTDLYIDVYKSYLGSLNSEKYLGYHFYSDSAPPVPKVEIDTTNFYKKLQEIKFLEVLQQKYPKNFIQVVSTLGRSREYGGIIIDQQVVYYVFCYEVGLIGFLKESRFGSNQIGFFLKELSGFESELANTNFERNYDYMNNKESVRYYPFKSKNLEKVEEILSKL